MTDELERRVRDSLQARAGDVAATPSLWRAVRERADRRRRRRVVLTVSTAVAAVALAAVVTPAVLARLDRHGGLELGGAPSESASAVASPTTVPSPSLMPPDMTPPPPTGPPVLPQFREPPPCPDGTEGTHPDLIATDGLRVTVRELCAVPSGPWTIHALPDGAESRIVEVSVRPGSRADDLTVAYLEEGEGMYALGWIHSDGRRSIVETFPAPYQLEHAGTDGSVPAPVWSPDGQYLTWVEPSPDGPVLRVIGWDDGPGTGRTADDNASFGLEHVWSGTVSDPGDVSMRVQEWLALDPDRVSGQLYLSATYCCDVTMRMSAQPIQRQPDGAVAIPSESSTLEPREDQYTEYVDWAAGDPGSVDESTPRYVLQTGGGSESEPRFQLTVLAGDPEGTQMVLPTALGASYPPAVWMTAAGDGVLLGIEGAAWLVTADGVTALEGTVRYADFIS